MSDTSPISPVKTTPLSRLNGSRASIDQAPSDLQPGITRPSDRLELSDRAVLLSRLRDLPAVRADLVQRVKSEIDTGAYDTPDKLDAAVRALVDEFANPS